MITVLENAQTRAKKTLNFVDHKGKVVGFNPMPDGERLRFQLRGPSGRTVLTEADMLSIVRRETDLNALAKALFDAAYTGGSADNISLVLVRNEGGVEL